MLQVSVNNVSCYQTASQPSHEALSQAAVALLSELGESVDACYLPLIEAEVASLNASSIQAAQQQLSPLCTQQFCCSLNSSAQAPAQQLSGLGLHPLQQGPLQGPQASSPQVGASRASCCMAGLEPGGVLTPCDAGCHHTCTICCASRACGAAGCTTASSPATCYVPSCSSIFAAHSCRPQPCHAERSSRASGSLPDC